MCSNRPDRAVREDERRHITGVPTSTWYELQGDGKAPKPFPLTKGTVAWSFNKLVDWVEARKRGVTWCASDEEEGAWQTLGDAAERVVTKSRAR